MKTLIAYDSFNGCTEECAKIIQKKLKGEVFLRKGTDLKKLDIDEFDKIVIGSPIRFGKLAKVLRSLLKRTKISLCKKIHIFLCVLCLKMMSQIISKNFMAIG